MSTTTRVKLVTGNDATLFEERLERALASLPDGAEVLGVEFDACATDGGGVHYAALIRAESAAPWD